MHHRQTKDLLYEQVARIGKACSSPKRLELLELLAQGEKSVERLASEVSIDIKLASAHLQVLKSANLVTTRKEGKFVFYRLTDPDVATLWVNLRTVAQVHLVELRMALGQMTRNPDKLTSISRKQLLQQAKRGEVIVIDARPANEFAQGHIPYARSMPVHEIVQRMCELPLSTEIIAYCRGPFCLFADEAVQLLRAHGRSAHAMRDGIAEWQAAGMQIESLLAT